MILRTQIWVQLLLRFLVTTILAQESTYFKIIAQIPTAHGHGSQSSKAYERRQCLVTPNELKTPYIHAALYYTVRSVIVHVQH